MMIIMGDLWLVGIMVGVNSLYYMTAMSEGMERMINIKDIINFDT